MAKTNNAVSPEQEAFTNDVNAASKALYAAKTADDVRKIWKEYFGTLGHRTLGRLIIGMSAETIIAKKFKD